MPITKSEAKLAAAHYMWSRAHDLSYKLDALQLRIDNTIKNVPAKKICILSSRQIGKSFWVCIYALWYLINNPGKIARIVAPTLKQCGDIVQDNLAKIILDAPPGMIEPKKSDYRWELQNGSSLRLGALERANVDGNRGGNASLVIYEECGFVKQDDFIYGVNSVLGPQLLRSQGWEIYVSSPSEDPDHPLHTQVLPECENLGTAFNYMVFESPSITREMIAEAMRRSGCAFDMQFIDGVYNLPKLSLEAVHEAAKRTEAVLTEAFRREYLAEIIRPSTLMVVPAYREPVHVVSFQLPLACHMTITIDWGGVRDLTAAILHTYDFHDDVDLVWDEMVWPANTSTDEIYNGLQVWEEVYRIESRWGDVPGQLQVDLTNQFKYEINLPQKSDWKASVNNMAVRFATNKIKIHPRCKFIQKSCRAGMFNKNRTDFERTNDLGHCDGLAALMYAIRSQNRENPYGLQGSRHDNVLITKRNDSEIVKLGDALNPKRFGSFR